MRGVLTKGARIDGGRADLLVGGRVVGRVEDWLAPEIVRAVNSHDVLLKSAKLLLEEVESDMETVFDNPDEIRELREAIEIAEGGKK